MPTGVINIEVVSHRQLSGDVLVRNVDITGWDGPGKKLNTISENGRLWGVSTGAQVNLYRSRNEDGTYDAGELVLSGVGAAGDLITLTEANSSGLSGYLRYQGSGDFDIIFTHCTEDDVISKIPGESQQLVWMVIGEQLNAPRRLQPLLDEAKVIINDRLIREMQDKGLGIFKPKTDGTFDGDPFPIDALGRYELAVLSNPEQLRDLQVWTVLREAALKLIGSNDYAEVVEKRYNKEWHNVWQNLRLWIDVEADLQHDGNERVSPVAYKPKRG